MALTIIPIQSDFGAIISGIDITRPVSDQDRKDILKASDDYSVIVFQDTGLDNATHIEFSRIFGHLEPMPSFSKILNPTGGSRDSSPAEYGPYISGITNLTDDGDIVASDPPADFKPRKPGGDRMWHTDNSFMVERAGYSALAAYVVPEEGGDTQFADLRAAHDDLPESLRQQIDGLEAEHSFWWTSYLAGYDISEEDVMKMPATRHPLIHTLRSGRKSLYLSAHIRGIAGMEPEAGRALVRELTEFAGQPKYVLTYKWSAGDLVVWSDLATMHRAAGFDASRFKRNMRRTTIRAWNAPMDDDQAVMTMFRESMAMLGRSAELAEI